MVRRAVGYQRYDTSEQVAVLNELYSHLRLLTNFFLPVMKLKSKERIGSKVKKRYDEPRTPYQRLLLSPDVSKKDKRRLREQYQKLNPAALKRQIEKRQDKLASMPTKEKKELNRRWRKSAPKGREEALPFR